jgi:hypothetical protein
VTGPEHYAEAERLARDALTYEGLPSNAHIQLGQVAQVHAMLALAASAPLADIVGILTEIRDEIARLPSSGRAS